MHREDNIFDRKGQNDIHWTSMIYHNGVFSMFFNYGMNQSGPAPYMTGLATSHDGIKFDIVNPIVIAPTLWSWDSQFLEVHSIIRLDGKWMMYYCGYNGNWRIGMAESEDMVSWEKYPNCILDVGDKCWENTLVADPHVIFFKKQYLMFYMGKGTVWQLGLATSYDGKEWYRFHENPIMKAEGWCDGCICLSGVIIYNDRLLATMHGYNKKTEKFTTKLFKSDDGIVWNEVTYADRSEFSITPGEWNDVGTVHPEMILIDGKIIIYYTGIRNTAPKQHRVGRVIIDVKDLLL